MHIGIRKHCKIFPKSHLYKWFVWTSIFNCGKTSTSDMSKQNFAGHFLRPLGLGGWIIYDLRCETSDFLIILDWYDFRMMLVMNILLSNRAWHPFRDFQQAEREAYDKPLFDCNQMMTSIRSSCDFKLAMNALFRGWGTNEKRPRGYEITTIFELLLVSRDAGRNVPQTLVIWRAY